MLFKGTDKWGPGYIDRAVEGVGGRTNATTSFDYTDFYLVVPAEALETAVQTLADMAFRSTFDPKEVDRERQVIFEEANIQADNPRTAIVRNIYSLVFADNPYGYPPLGTRDDLGRGDERQAQGVQPSLLHAGEHDAGRGRPRRGPEGARPGRSHLRHGPRHGLQGHTRAGAPAAPRRLAPDGGAPGAAGLPRDGLAGPARRRCERRRRGPAHHDPRRLGELAPRPPPARRRAPGQRRQHELLGADGRRHRLAARGARGQGPRPGRAHRPGGDREDAGQRPHRGGAPVGRHQVRSPARVRHRDLRGPRQCLRPRRDDVDPRRRAGLRRSPAQDHAGADPRRRPAVPVAGPTTPRSASCRGSHERRAHGRSHHRARRRSDRRRRARRRRHRRRDTHAPRQWRDPAGPRESHRPRGGRLAHGQDGHPLGDAGDRGDLELPPDHDGARHHVARRHADRRDGRSHRRQHRRVRRRGLLRDRGHRARPVLEGDARPGGRRRLAAVAARRHAYRPSATSSSGRSATAPKSRIPWRWTRCSRGHSGTIPMPGIRSGSRTASSASTAPPCSRTTAATTCRRAWCWR